jgi:NodT family efflux transporter outer membrane factor (OMF) lipoprotein
MTRFPIIFLSLSLLAGCTVGPNYQAPQMPVEESFESLPAPAATPSYATTPGQSPASQWWATLHDPILNSLIEQATRANHDLRLAAARVREARARRAIVAAGQYPELNAGAQYSDMRASENAWPYNALGSSGLSFPFEAGLYQAGFDASWELDVFGAVRRSVEASSADLAASVEERRSVLVSVLAEVARNYVELRSFQQRFEIAQHNLEAQRQTLELTAEQAREGVARQLDVSRAMALVSTTEAGLPQLRNLQWQAMHRLAVLTGQQPGALVATLSSSGAVPVPPTEVVVGVPAELLRRRPDIRRAERELAAATARVGEATADLYPRFRLTGSFNLQSSDTSKFFDWASRSWGIGPAVEWPIFNAGALRAAVKVRDAQQEQALVRYEQTVLQALAEVHDALTTFITEQDRRRSLQAAVKANEESAELSEGLFRQGETDFTTVLDARRQLYRSQEDLLQSDATVTTSLIALYKALGGGWETVDPPQPDQPEQAKKQSGER